MILKNQTHRYGKCHHHSLNYFIDNDLRGGIIAQNPDEEGGAERSPTRRDSDGDNPEE